MEKSKYSAWLEEYGLEYIRRLAEEGLTDEKIATRSSLELSVYRRYKRRYPEFAEAIALGKASADYAVVRSLYKRATGYNVTLNKTYKLKRVDYDPETGKKVREYEELATGADETHVPADLRAETFWLKSRQGDRWSDKQEHTAPEGEGPGVVVIPEADMIDEEE